MTIKDIVLTALFAALIAALGFMPAIPGMLVPITLQSLGVMLAGAILGAKRGSIVVLIIWILVAAGMPILAFGRGGLMLFTVPTSGYLYGWLIGVFIIGWGYDHFKNKLNPTIEISILIFGGIIAIHLCGILWLILWGYLSLKNALLTDLIFVPGDIAKVIFTFFILRSLRKALPGKI